MCIARTWDKFRFLHYAIVGGVPYLAKFHVCVPFSGFCAVKICNLSAATCQDVSSLGRQEASSTVEYHSEGRRRKNTLDEKRRMGNA